MIHEDSDTVNPHIIALQQSPFTQEDIWEAHRSMSRVESVVQKRVTEELLSSRQQSHWPEQLAAQALSGALVGAVLEAGLVMAENMMSDAPENEQESLLANLLGRSGYGAVWGGLMSASSWMLHQGSGMPLWLSGLLVAAQFQMVSEQYHNGCVDVRALAIAHCSMELGALAGESVSPVPLPGSFVGAIMARLLLDRAFTFLSEDTNP